MLGTAILIGLFFAAVSSFLAGNFAKAAAKSNSRKRSWTLFSLFVALAISFGFPIFVAYLATMGSREPTTAAHFAEGMAWFAGVVGGILALPGTGIWFWQIWRSRGAGA